MIIYVFLTSLFSDTGTGTRIASDDSAERLKRERKDNYILHNVVFNVL